jgi:hypothetical protein
MVTEVPALESALHTARVAWPDEPSASRLIAKLAALGAQKLEENPETAFAAKRARLEAGLGQFSFSGGLVRLAQLREEWD